MQAEKIEYRRNKNERSKAKKKILERGSNPRPLDLKSNAETEMVSLLGQTTSLIVTQ